MLRATRNDNPDVFTDTGQRAAGKMVGAILAHAGRPVRDVLDWSCGCGRVSRWLAEYDGITLHGCDPDAEAVAWCREHIRGEFVMSGLMPPLPYGDGSFDAIVAVSVFTHLNRRQQRIWLRELARVLRPGGVLAASVHGQAAAESFGVPVIAGGIDDKYRDDAMAGVIPDRYYGATLQTETFTRNSWSGWFDVVAWQEAALDAHDLVTCRVRDLPPA